MNFWIRNWCFKIIVTDFFWVSIKFSDGTFEKPALTLSGPGRGGGGAQRTRWPNSQLPIRNLLLYDAQTWWLLVFILKTRSDQILAKLINGGGGGGGGWGLLLLFSHRDVPKILKMKKFSSAWKLLKLTWRVNFGSKRTILDIKNSFFKS